MSIVYDISLIMIPMLTSLVRSQIHLKTEHACFISRFSFNSLFAYTVVILTSICGNTTKSICLKEDIIIEGIPLLTIVLVFLIVWLFVTKMVVDGIPNKILRRILSFVMFMISTIITIFALFFDKII